jgi:hypothetical protein
MPESITGVHVSRSEPPGGVRISVPAGTSLDKIFRNEAMVRAIRGPGGSTTCISGRDLHLHQFDEVVLVELTE